MILAGPPVATTPNHYHHHIVDGIFRKIASDLAYGLTISAFSTDGERVYIVAPNLVSAAKWEATYPERHMSVDGHLVSLHIAVTGDVEGRCAVNRYYAIGEHVFLAADVEQAGTSAHAHPVVVIDPETASDADLAPLLSIGTVENARDVLRAMLNPKPEEPTDPKARVTDRRENVWRLLADGDWVCTDGPDIGEYLVWWQLAERGPLTVEGVTA